MTIEENRTTSAPVDLPTGRYRLDPELTTVAFSARKLGLFTIRGTMRLVSGTFTVARTLDRSTLRAVLAADSFTTPMRRRDEHVKGPTLLDAATYPHVEFDSTEVAAAGDGWEIRGVLAVHGKVAPAVLAVEAASFDHGLARVRARARVDRRDFGVTGQRAAASSLIDIRIEAVGSPVGRSRHDG
jgi:polyisoprenoid-binding protein YceI